MDDRFFDDLSRVLGSQMRRREALQVLAGMAGTGALTLLFPTRFEAATNATACRGETLTYIVPCGHHTSCFCPAGFMCCTPSGPCCLNGDICCGTLCCNGVTGETCCNNQRCCPPGSECCGAAAACCRPKGTNGPGDKGEKCCSTLLATLVCCDLNTHCCGIDTLGECVTKAGMRIIRFRTATPAGIVIEVTDPDGQGLVSISVADSVNASVQIPPLPPRTTVADVTASRIDPSQPARVVLRVCTRGSCCVDGDPTLTALQIGEGRNNAKDTFFDIPSTEHFLRIQNGRPGLRRVEILVNGRSLTERWLRDGNVRVVDLAPLMTERRNEITLLANGRPGSSGIFLVSDLSDSGGEGKSAAPLIDWQPGSWDPSVSLHWGR